MELLKRCLNRDLFFYLGLILITFNIFPFLKYGLGSSKALSIIPFAIYLFQTLIFHKIDLTSYLKKEILYAFLFLFFSFLCSFISLQTFDGSFTAVSMWMTYLIIILSFSAFFQQAGRNKILLFFECIFFSFKISLFFGLLEVFYFKISSISFIHSFVSFFVRDEQYLDGGRVQFNLGEPGDAGVYFIILLIPVLIALKKLQYRFSFFEKITVFLLFLITATMSSSFSFYFIGFSVLYFYYLFKIWSNKRLRYILIFIFLLFSIAVLYIANSEELYYYAYATDNRFLKILTNRGGDNMDKSFAVRLGMWVVSMDIWKNYFITGVGWGNFGYYFREAYNHLDSVYINDEMTNKLTQSFHLQSYSIYSTALVEGGLIGFFWLKNLISNLLWKDSFVKCIIPVFLIVLLQSMLLYVPITCLVYYILSNKKLNSYLI